MNILQSWNDFSKEWKRVRRKFRERPVHDFRVATRRLISELELGASLTRDAESASLIRRFNKILKRLGPLRDFQVHIRRLDSLERSELLIRFESYLKDREGAEVRQVRKKMTERKRKHLRRGVREVHKSLEKILPEMTKVAIQSAIQGSIEKHFHDVVSARAVYRRTSNPENLHKLRVQSKRYRYTVEAADPKWIRVSKKKIEGMRELQAVLGEVHDLDTFCTELGAWSGDSGKTVVAQLHGKRRELMKAFKEVVDPSSGPSGHLLPSGEGSLSRRERVPRSGG